MGQAPATTQLLDGPEHNRTKAQTLLKVRATHRQLENMSTFQNVPSAHSLPGEPSRRRWLTLPQAARESGLSLYLIRRAVKTGELGRGEALRPFQGALAEVLESRLRTDV